MKSKLKPKFKLADEFLDLKTADTNMIIEELEELIKLRELPIQEHAKRLRKLMH